MCSSSHNVFLRNKEKDGCIGVVEFANVVCDDYYRCIMESKSESFCQPKICDKFEVMPKNKDCFNDSFSCD
ncbi:hypothetical protein Y032_0124g1199 [Ancylostoma ceylanicum]|uniref:Uncharacterized protein n=1 Tax=Ancylostoma ceylanicum TaxID=53326 RepID=A0A016T940_9BILA|nr:hypothetical protein Y032_0124g1199 [Ancylostoma ceylanicum]